MQQAERGCSLRSLEAQQQQTGGKGRRSEHASQLGTAAIGWKGTVNDKACTGRRTRDLWPVAQAVNLDALKQQQLLIGLQRGAKKDR